jgi:multidrug efflux pump subunit AcrA (membrane-fusion protein)
VNPRIRSGRPNLSPTLMVIGVILLGGLLMGGGCSSRKADATPYNCPMHPTYVSDRPGDCPICGMRLVPVKPAQSGEAEQSTSDTETGVADMATVTMNAEEMRLTGVMTAVAERAPFARTVRAVGTVKADETRVQRVQTRVGGYVEQLQANFLGQLIHRGDPVLGIYSPELLSSQEEFLRARETAKRFATSSLPETRRGGEDLLRASRQRLELFGVPGSFLANLEQTGLAERVVTLTAPISGYITAKDVSIGQRVEPGRELFTVTDLSSVWVEAAFYESEAPAIVIGATATLTLPYDPSLELQGRVAYIYPYLNPDTRTLPVRFDVPNPGLALKPGMYANVELVIDQGEQVTVPDNAVMDTGSRQIVFVAGANGKFTPRLVTVGARSNGRASILTGLAPGEQVVVKANFLLDSESRLRAAIAGATSPKTTPAPGDPHAGGGQ